MSQNFTNVISINFFHLHLKVPYKDEALWIKLSTAPQSNLTWRWEIWGMNAWLNLGHIINISGHNLTRTERLLGLSGYVIAFNSLMDHIDCDSWNVQQLCLMATGCLNPVLCCFWLCFEISIWRHLSPKKEALFHLMQTMQYFLELLFRPSAADSDSRSFIFVEMNRFVHSLQRLLSAQIVHI